MAQFYFFICAAATGDLDKIKTERRGFLEKWWDEVQADVKTRVG